MGMEGTPQEPVDDKVKAEEMAHAGDFSRSRAAQLRAEGNTDSAAYRDEEGEGAEERASFLYDEEKKAEAMSDEELELAGENAYAAEQEARGKFPSEQDMRNANKAEWESWEAERTRISYLGKTVSALQGEKVSRQTKGVWKSGESKAM
jgi:hypothetical protein